jgi:hypothetical protein
MSFDSAKRVAPHRQAVHWHLPVLLSVEAYRVRYETPRRHTIRGKDHKIHEAVEVVVETSEPFPVRALGPVLYVGETALTVAEEDGDRRYRFRAPDSQRLEPGAPIAIGWNSPGAPRAATGFTYEPPLETLERR